MRFCRIFSRYKFEKLIRTSCILHYIWKNSCAELYDFWYVKTSGKEIYVSTVLNKNYLAKFLQKKLLFEKGALKQKVTTPLRWDISLTLEIIVLVYFYFRNMMYIRNFVQHLFLFQIYSVSCIIIFSPNFLKSFGILSNLTSH